MPAPVSIILVVCPYGDHRPWSDMELGDLVRLGVTWNWVTSCVLERWWLLG